MVIYAHQAETIIFFYGYHAKSGSQSQISAPGYSASGSQAPAWEPICSGKLPLPVIRSNGSSGNKNQKPGRYLQLLFNYFDLNYFDIHWNDTIKQQNATMGIC